MSGRMFYKPTGGRPRQVVSEETRQKVLALRELNIPIKDIPKYVDIGQHTVRRVLDEARRGT